MTNITLPTAIFFDWDGTLVDTFGLLEQSHNHALETLGLNTDCPNEYPTGWFLKYFGGQRDQIYLDIYGADLALTARGLFEDYFSAHHCSLISTINGAVDLLETLKKLSIPMGVVSNKKPEFVKPEITHLGFDHYFETIVGAGQAANDKPSPDSILLGLSQAGITPSRDVWYIGDSINDYLAAEAVGLNLVFIESSKPASTLPGKPMQVFKDCQAFNEFILSLA